MQLVILLYHYIGASKVTQSKLANGNLSATATRDLVESLRKPRRQRQRERR